MDGNETVEPGLSAASGFWNVPPLSPPKTLMRSARRQCHFILFLFIVIASRRVYWWWLSCARPTVCFAGTAFVQRAQCDKAPWRAYGPSALW